MRLRGSLLAAMTISGLHGLIRAATKGTVQHTDSVADALGRIFAGLPSGSRVGASSIALLA